jgi:hypothetical protein
MSKLREAMFSRDEAAAASVRSTPIVELGATVLAARRHVVPSIGLAMLHAGWADGCADRVFDALAPKLRAVIDDMSAHPSAYHVISTSPPGLDPDDIVQAFFACGLGAEFAKASERVEQAARAVVKGLAIEVKKARSAGRQVNLVANLVSEGFESRLSELAASGVQGDPLIAGPKPKAPARGHLAPEPVVKTYAAPRR